MQDTTKIGIFRKPSVVNGLVEAGEEAGTEVVVGAGAGVQLEHRRVTSERAVLRWTTEHFTQVGRQPFEMLGMARMREGMIQNGIGQASSVEGGGERQERVVAPHVVIDALTLNHGFIMSARVIDRER